MPMAQIGSWIEKVVGAPLPASSPLVSVDGIAERRAFYQELPAAAEPPGSELVTEGLVLRKSPGAPLVAEVYRPLGSRTTSPAFLYMHGGAFCIWNARMVRRIAMRIAAAGFVVVNLDYRLAPEHPHPAALIDVLHAARWIHRHHDELGIDMARGLSIGGDSSGANLAAAAISYLHGHSTALDTSSATDPVPIRIRQALLLCGIYDLARRLCERPSAPGTTEIMVNLAYLGPHFLSKHGDPLVSPALADNLADFPRTYIACGAKDATLPQSLNLTEKLANHGVDTTLSVLAGGDHEMLMLTEEDLPGVDAEWARIESWLNAS